MNRQARVVAAYATVKTLDPATGKWTVYGFHQGAVFPPSADPEDVARLVRREYAEWIDAEVPDAAAAAYAELYAAAEPPADSRPAQNAPKADWVAYAVSQRADGVSEDDAQSAAEGKSKADLIAEFGS